VILTKSPKGGEVSGSGQQECIINGLLNIAGLVVGGGPIINPEPPGPDPGPIEPPETTPPVDWIKPPPSSGSGWGYSEDTGWVFVYNPGSTSPGPKR
jgi:hypothetical protein